MSQNVESWIGRTESHSDTLRSEPARFMQATIGREATLQNGDALPPLWHWLYFLNAKPLGELGRDGHPQKGAAFCRLLPCPVGCGLGAGSSFIPRCR